jgi:hypothetical protein
MQLEYYIAKMDLKFKLSNLKKHGKESNRGFQEILKKINDKNMSQ